MKWKYQGIVIHQDNILEVVNVNLVPEPTVNLCVSLTRELRCTGSPCSALSCLVLGTSLMVSAFSISRSSRPGPSSELWEPERPETKT